MRTSTPNLPTGRSRLFVVVAAVLGVTLVVTAAVWGASRIGAPSSRPNAATVVVTTAASTAAASGGAAVAPVTPKAVAPRAVAPKATTGKPAGPTPGWVKKLPAGVVEPGREVTAPVDTQTTSVAASVKVDLTGFKAVTSKASGLGEISAPAVRLSVRLTNTGRTALTLTTVVVNAYYGSAGTPGVLILGDPASRPFTGSLRPGAAATAVFVFNMPVSKRSDATITVSPSPTLPIAIFAGSVS